MKSVAKPLHFHPLVVSDLQAAIEWYERISPTAAEGFRVAANGGFRAISRVGHTASDMASWADRD
jgi:hypothetical protein